ncbi:MAG: hypothetical protein AAFV69_11650 [Pseudomonadota bacterium]
MKRARSTANPQNHTRNTTQLWAHGLLATLAIALTILGTHPVWAQSSTPKHNAAPPVAPTDFSAMEPLELGRDVTIQRCSNCHSLSPDKKGFAAPLHNLYGRTSGTAEGYFFSPILKNLAVEWSSSTLSNWLAQTTFDTPDIRMRHVGIQDPRTRQALIAYIGTLEGNRPKAD